MSVPRTEAGRKSIKMPRASLAVSLLTDADYLSLMLDGPSGRGAFAAFVGLLVAAKQQRNQGHFDAPLPIVAAMIGWSSDDLDAALTLIEQVCKRNKNRPWVTRRNGHIRIRSFAKWNTSRDHGGARSGSGRPRKPRKNQVENNLKPTRGASALALALAPGTVRTSSAQLNSVARTGGSKGGTVRALKKTASQQSACDACPEPIDNGRLLRAVNLLNDSPVSRRSLPKLIEATKQLAANGHDPLKILRPIIDRSKGKVNAGGYISTAYLEEAGAKR